MMPVEHRPAATDVGNEQIRLRILLVGRVEFGDGPGSRNRLRRGHARAPLQGPGQRRVVAQENDIVVATRASGAAPFDAREANELALLGRRAAPGDSIGPGLVGDLKVVGGISQHIECADLAAVRQVPGRVLSADGVVRVHVQIGEVGALGGKVFGGVDIAV
jgi:hypothetical protein